MKVTIYYHNLDKRKSYAFTNEYIHNADALYVKRNIKNSTDSHFYRLAAHIVVLKNILNIDSNPNHHYFISETQSSCPVKIENVIKKHNIKMLLMEPKGVIHGTEVDAKHKLFKLKGAKKKGVGYNIGYAKYIIKRDFIPELIKTLLPIKGNEFKYEHHFDIALRQSKLVTQVHSLKKMWNSFENKQTKFINIERERCVKFQSSVAKMNVKPFDLETEPIDAVVLWVDSNDKKWQKLLAKHSSQKLNFNDVRFKDSGELRYCLRGLYYNAPWLRRIYLVTCGHTPSWLDLSQNDKIELVSHDQIFPKGALPCFNSSAIEMCLHRIPGLSNYFLYSNDDMFITKPTTKRDFFNGLGRPYFYENKTNSLNNININNKVRITFQNNSIMVNKLFKHKKIHMRPIHQVCILNKMLIKNIVEDVLSFNNHNKFRADYHEPDDLSHYLFLTIMNELNYSKTVKYINNKELFIDDYKCLPKEVPMFVCMNKSAEHICDLERCLFNQIPGEKHFKIVVSKFKEDISWLSLIAKYCIIYNKYHQAKNQISIPNVGRESDTYLKFIIEHYDNLPDVVVFTQANISDHKGNNNASFLYELANEAFKNGKSLPYKHYETKKWSPWNKDWNYKNKRFYLESNYKNDQKMLFSKWFKENIDVQYDSPFHIYKNGIFAVSKSLIRSRTKQFYKRIITFANHHINPAEGHFFERSWYYIFERKLGFIHITKTGGTDLKDRGCGSNIMFGPQHDEDARFYKKLGIPCFAIIRDPVQRYISLYTYNKHGSNKYKKTTARMFEDINEFVANHYFNRDYINYFENGIQFRSQMSWLQDADKNNTYIIAYDKTTLDERIKRLCIDIGIKLTKNTQKRINVTNNYKYDLSEISRKRILEMYSDDHAFFQKLTSPYSKLSML